MLAQIMLNSSTEVNFYLIRKRGNTLQEMIYSNKKNIEERTSDYWIRCSVWSTVLGTLWVSGNLAEKYEQNKDHRIEEQNEDSSTESVHLH